ncbi:MAG: glycosyltransferase family 39 protein [Candidatus Omnitrophota bacterium]|nr:glycosyltransferase family 39 protein [Candidatus Omnitrophota bacterium]
MKSKSLKSLTAPGIILIIFLAHLFLNIFWIKIDSNQRIMGDDVFIHLFNNLTVTSQLGKAIKEHDIVPIVSQLKSGAIISSGPVDKYAWPRLVYFVSSIFNLLFGVSLPITIISNMFWFLILIVSIYLIGKYLFNKETGLFAAFLTSFSPFIWGMSRKYGLDFPLVAVTSLSMYFLLKTEGFRSKLYTILFFAALGIGFNVKMQILIYLLIPTVINIFNDEMKPTFFEKSRNIFLGIMIFIVLSSIFWWGCLNGILGLFFLQQTKGLYDSAFEHKTPLLASSVFYLDYLLRGLNLVLLLSIFGIYRMFRSAQKNRLLILSWAIVPMLIFLIMNPQRGRYILPVFPAFCLIASNAVINLKNRLYKYFLIGLSFIVYGCSLILITLGPENYYGLKKGLEFIGYCKNIHQPDLYDFDIVARKFSAIIQKNNVQGLPCKIGILERANFYMFNDDPAVMLYNIRLNMPGQFFALEENALRSSHIAIKNFIKELPSLKFLIVFTKDKEEIVDYKNIISSRFYDSESLDATQQDLVKKYLADFEVLSKEETYIRKDKFLLNLLMHK